MNKEYSGGAIYLKVDGHDFPRQPGRASKHMGWYPVESVSYALDTNRGRSPTGHREDSGSADKLDVMRRSDAGTAALQLICAKGEVVPRMELDIYRRAGKALIRASHITLERCTINEFATLPSRPPQPPLTRFRIECLEVMKTTVFQ